MHHIAPIGEVSWRADSSILVWRWRFGGLSLWLRFLAMISEKHRIGLGRTVWEKYGLEQEFIGYHEKLLTTPAEFQRQVI